jgi:hypothetical protein
MPEHEPRAELETGAGAFEMGGIDTRTGGGTSEIGLGDEREERRSSNR